MQGGGAGLPPHMSLRRILEGLRDDHDIVARVLALWRIKEIGAGAVHRDIVTVRAHSSNKTC